MSRRGNSSKNKFPWFKSTMVTLIVLALITNIYILLRYGIQVWFDNFMFYCAGGTVLAIGIAIGGYMMGRGK